MQYQVKIGGVLIKGDAENEKDMIRKVAFFQSLPDECPLCQSSVNLFYRSPQDYDYYGLQCSGKVMHESNFGQYKDGKGLFYKAKWQKAFQESDEKPERKQSQSPDEPPPPEEPPY